MAEEVKEAPKKKARIETKQAEAKSSVSTYKQGIEVEKQKMGTYAKKMGTNVKTLQAGFKKHAKDMKDAALNMREEGIKNMTAKVGKFKRDIKDQIKENNESIAHMQDNINYYLSAIKKKKNEFRAYARGPFNDYIKAFWGQ